MTIDLTFKVLQFLRNLIGIEKSARHFKFDFQISKICCLFWFISRRSLVGGAWQKTHLTNVHNKNQKNILAKHFFLFQLNLS